MSDWKIFVGNGDPHDSLTMLPEPPPWRFAREALPILSAEALQLPLDQEAVRARTFLPTSEMVVAVNAALYLRRPLLLTGKPGSGKSTLISKVAHELRLGPVLRWPINSRSTVRGGVYEYDAVGRLQAGKEADPPVEDYMTLGPLGTALMETARPRALLIDEIDKSDIDFANDLLNVIEEGEYEIPELRRLKVQDVRVRDASDRMVTVSGGRLRAGHFPFVVMTSNAEREFPAAFLRRCIRLTIEPPDPEQLAKIVEAHLKRYEATLDHGAVAELISEFVALRSEKEVATDQLLNAVFLTVAMRGATARQFDAAELLLLRSNLLRQLSGAGA